MGKLILFKIGEGDINQGFPILLQMGDDGAPPETDKKGILPPLSQIMPPLEEWQTNFRDLADSRGIKPQPATKNASFYRQKADDVTTAINNWLNSDFPKWKKIREALQRYLNINDEIRVIIQTENPQLRQLPWHLWDLFKKDYPHTEIAVSAPEYEPPQGRKTPPKGKVRILAIFGQSPDKNIPNEIKTQNDWEAINSLPYTEIKRLDEPTPEELRQWLWHDLGWHILFFAGHSESDTLRETGWIQINPQQRITISELKNALKTAIENGLQLAIFNSCDGLGLAKQLEDLHLPQVMVMREKVPDKVAQQFLRHFLTAFAGNHALYMALREARLKLEDDWEMQYPGVSWLPVISQYPAIQPPTYQGLHTGGKAKPLIFQNFQLRKNPLVSNTGKLLKSLLSQLIQAERARNFELVINLGEQILKIDIQHQIARTKTAQAYKQRILNYYNQGKYDEAIKDGDRAIELKPDFAEIYYQRARAYYQKNNFQEVIENCTKAINLKKEADYYWQRGLAYYEKNNYDQAILDAENSIKLNLSSTKADYYYLSGRSLYAKAISIIAPQAVESTFMIVYPPNFYYPLFSIDPEKSKQMNSLLGEALNFLNKAIQANPNLVANYYWLRGLCYLAQGNQDFAIKDFNEANNLNRNQTNYNYNYLMGLSYQTKNDQDWAIIYFSFAILNNPSKTEYYYCRSLSYFNRGKSIVQNLIDWENRYKNDPQLAMLFKGNNKSDDMLALEDIEKARELEKEPLHWGFSQLKYQIEKRMSGRR
ncbi:CHAT domain-containing protein [Planktothrix pseudagardhii]|uniref:Tetratricopeptide repeat protein 13 n=1 Tax=Planktothrix pseudagardhii TaxID=132604 RepID=A0A9W4G862_9CYAN|nr:CHAT domain-containing protein [Planktothrix pseudagardhii]CAD5972320.1 Tetratricopeptide repeat protein 13 [Planktothrix pseudagardhii]